MPGGVELALVDLLSESVRQSAARLRRCKAFAMSRGLAPSANHARKSRSTETEESPASILAIRD